jgi:hypothetical protein
VFQPLGCDEVVLVRVHQQLLERQKLQKKPAAREPFDV